MTNLTRRAALRLTALTAALPLAGTAARAASHAAVHTVRISDFAFVPASITITPGDQVIFVNDDSAPHTATAQGLFDTGRLGQGQQASLTFGSAGTYNYICSFHPNMKGTITVA